MIIIIGNSNLIFPLVKPIAKILKLHLLNAQFKISILDGLFLLVSQPQFGKSMSSEISDLNVPATFLEGVHLLFTSYQNISPVE